MVRQLYLVLVLFGISGCTAIYRPNTIPVAMLQEKGDIHTGFYMGTAGFEAQGGYAVNDFIGVIGGYQFSSPMASSGDRATKKSYNYGEVAGGVFKKIDEYVLLDVYSGIGTGAFNYEREFDPWTGSSEYVVVNGQLTRWFLQPSFSLVSEYADFSFTPRWVTLFYNNNQIYDNLVTNARGYDHYLEPVITLKLGWKYLKVIGQTGLSIPFTDASDFNNISGFAHQPFIFSVGINLNMSQRFYDLEEEKQEP